MHCYVSIYWNIDIQLKILYYSRVRERQITTYSESKRGLKIKFELQNKKKCLLLGICTKKSDVKNTKFYT